MCGGQSPTSQPLTHKHPHKHIRHRRPPSHLPTYPLFNVPTLPTHTHQNTHIQLTNTKTGTIGLRPTPGRVEGAARPWLSRTKKGKGRPKRVYPPVASSVTGGKTPAAVGTLPVSGQGAAATSAGVAAAVGAVVGEEEEVEEDEGMLDPENAHLAGVDGWVGERVGCCWRNGVVVGDGYTPIRWRRGCAAALRICIPTYSYPNPHPVRQPRDSAKKSDFRAPHRGGSHTTNTNRPMARTVPDLALFLDALVPRLTSEVRILSLLIMYIYIHIYTLYMHAHVYIIHACTFAFRRSCKKRITSASASSNLNLRTYTQQRTGACDRRLLPPDCRGGCGGGPGRSGLAGAYVLVGLTRGDDMECATCLPILLITTLLFLTLHCPFHLLITTLFSHLSTTHTHTHEKGVRRLAFSKDLGGVACGAKEGEVARVCEAAVLWLEKEGGLEVRCFACIYACAQGKWAKGR